jgi:hypothetical protein
MAITRETAISVLRASHLFQSFSDEQLVLVTQHAKIKEVKPGQILYRQGDESDAFYLIVTGDVTVDRLFDKKQEHVGDYSSGDYFGEEVLATKPKPRRTTVTVLSEAILMVLSVPALVTLLHEVPSFYGPLRLAQKSFEMLAHKTLTWRNQNEVVHLILRRHEYFLVQAIFLPLILFLAALGVTIFYSFSSFDNSWALMIGLLVICVLSALGIVWQALNWSNDYYIVTNQRVLFLNKVLLLYESRRETPLDAILATTVQTSYVGRWMGYGDVMVRTFTGLVTFQNVESPDLVLNLINQHWMRTKNVVAKEDKAEIEATIRRRLQPQNFKSRDASGHLVDAEPEEVKSGVLNSTMASMFQLRIESEDSITYRKHWFILLKRTWLLSLLIIGCIVLLILRLAGTLPFLDVYAVLGIWLIAMFIFGCAWAYQYMDWSNDVYIITPEQLIDIYRKPFGDEQKQAALLKNIQTIEYKRNGPLGYLLNFGTVYIRVGDTDFHFENVYDPSEVQRELFERFMVFKEKEQQANIQAERQRLGDWIETYHKVVGEEQNPPQIRPRRPN